MGDPCWQTLTPPPPPCSTIAQEALVQESGCSVHCRGSFIESRHLKDRIFTTQPLQPLTINMTNLSPCFCLHRRRAADRSRRLRSPGVIHHNKNGQSSSSSSAGKDGGSNSRPEAAGNNSRFSFLKGKGFKGIFQ